MGTRSRIAVMHGSVCKSVYCHWDGYLDHNGRILQEYYDSAKANNLVALGDLSSLRPNIGEKHAFSKLEVPMDGEAYDKLYGDMTTFYGRDRGEDGVSAKKFASYEDYLLNHQYEEYEYILRSVGGEAVWFVADHSNDFKPLLQALIAEEECVA